MGSCDLVEVREFGSKHCIVMQQTEDASRLTTIVLRGSTSNILDDFERAIGELQIWEILDGSVLFYVFLALFTLTGLALQMTE